MRQEKLRQKLVADGEKLCYFSLLFVHVLTLRIRNSESDPHCSDEKVLFVALDKLIETGVLVA